MAMGTFQAAFNMEAQIVATAISDKPVEDINPMAEFNQFANPILQPMAEVTQMAFEQGSTKITVQNPDREVI